MEAGGRRFTRGNIDGRIPLRRRAGGENYTTQLAAQEDRVEALRNESQDVERRRRDAQEELNRQIDAVSADIAVKS